MSAFALKLIAVVFMLIDHAGAILLYTRHISASPYWVMRSLGRIAFPLYAFLLTEGFRHTKSRRAYLERLTLFAIISQLPYSLALTQSNYSTVEYFNGFGLIRAKTFYAAAIAALAVFLIFYRKRCDKRFALITAGAFLLSGISVTVGGVTVWGAALNVMYTLAASMALIWLCELWREREKSIGELIPLSILTLALCVSVLMRSDYGLKGFVLIGGIYLCRSNRLAVCTVMAAWCVWKYFPYTPESVWCLLIGALASVVPAALYSGAQGRKTKLFYLVYPIHLLLYALAGIFVL